MKKKPEVGGVEQGKKPVEKHVRSVEELFDSMDTAVGVVRNMLSRPGNKDSVELAKLHDKMSSILSERDVRLARLIDVNTETADNLQEILEQDIADNKVYKEIQEVLGLYEQLSVVRISRQVELGRIMKQFRELNVAELEKLPITDLKTISSTIERKNWNSIFRLKKGEGVVAFTEPTFQSTKKFNDVLFGPLKTDTLIAERNILLRKKLIESESLGGQVSLLEQSFKNSFFKVEKGEKTMAEIISAINIICVEIDKEMTGIIDTAVDKELKGLTEMDSVKKERLQNFKEENLKSGFKIGFGVSEVADRDGGSRTDVARAVSEAWTASLVSRGDVSGKDAYGTRFESKAVVDIISENSRIRKEVEKNLNSRAVPVIHDINGKAHFVFVDNVLHINLLRELRKGTFKPCSEDVELTEKIEIYRQNLNKVDVVKPYTLEEISGQNNLQVTGESLDTRLTREQGLGGQIKKLVELREKSLKGDLSKEDQEIMDGLKQKLVEGREDVTNIVETSRDGVYSSNALFHCEATSIPNCAYITMDALDIGVRGAQLTDKLLQQFANDVETGKMEVSDILMQVGDQITRELRDFRMNVLAIAKQYYSDKIPTLVGGDEITLAVDTSKIEGGIDGAKLKDMLLAICANKGISTRLVMSEATKQTEGLKGAKGDGDLEQVIEHVDALRRAERGIEKAKILENLLRNLKLQVEADGTEGWEGGDLKQYSVLMKDLYNEGFVVRENKEKNFIISTKGEKDGRMLDEVVSAVLEFIKKHKK